MYKTKVKKQKLLYKNDQESTECQNIESRQLRHITKKTKTRCAAKGLIGVDAVAVAVEQEPSDAECLQTAS